MISTPKSSSSSPKDLLNDSFPTSCPHLLIFINNPISDRYFQLNYSSVWSPENSACNLAPFCFR